MFESSLVPFAIVSVLPQCLTMALAIMFMLCVLPVPAVPIWAVLVFLVVLLVAIPTPRRTLVCLASDLFAGLRNFFSTVRAPRAIVALVQAGRECVQIMQTAGADV